MDLTIFLIIFVLIFFAMVPISLVVEFLRPKPHEQDKLVWAEDIQIQHAVINDTKSRYIKKRNEVMWK